MRSPQIKRNLAGRTYAMSLAAALAVFAAGATVVIGADALQTAKKHANSPTKLTENDKIVHLLNRLAFGPRPDDIEKVRQMGIDAYIEQQLHPDGIDDTATDQKLQGFSELQMRDSDIESKYKDFITMDQSMNKLRQQIRRMEAQKLATQASGAQTGVTAGQTSTTNGTAMTTQAGQTPANGQPGFVAGGTQPGVTARQAIQDAMASDPELAKQLEDGRMQLAKAAEPIGLLHEQFSAAKLVRAVESQRQLQEVLVDFWSNHFNIDIRKAPCGILKVLDDRDTIRPHIFGKFRDLLEASAKSPAMLVYLDNFQSVSDTLPTRPLRRRQFGQFNQANFNLQNPNQTPGQLANPPKPGAPKRKIGLNENYAREIMELHTLGVTGGYSQQDVHEVARCLTGWGIADPSGLRPRINRYAEAGEFHFYPNLHDNGEKVVLGHHIPANGGMNDGEIVIGLLASDPATIKHVSYQLCQRLVCDEPPSSLVYKCVETWQKTDGDLREIYKTIFTSPEFYSPAAMNTKIKSPFEYAVSSVRALDGSLDPVALINQRQIPREANSLVRPPQGGGYLDINTNTLLGQIGTMGEPIFQYQAPTGFPENSQKWVSSGALISRLNFSLALTQGKIKDVKLADLGEDSGGKLDPSNAIDRLSARILHGEISPSTRATLLAEAKPTDGAMNSTLTPATIAALLLGSPEFQRR